MKDSALKEVALAIIMFLLGGVGAGVSMHITLVGHMASIEAKVDSMVDLGKERNEVVQHRLARLENCDCENIKRN